MYLVENFSGYMMPKSREPWCILWLVGESPRHDPRARKVEQSKQVKGHTERQNTARSIWRKHSDGCRECQGQVGPQELGEHESVAPRACCGGDDQRAENKQVLGLLGLPF